LTQGIQVAFGGPSGNYMDLWTVVSGLIFPPEPGTARFESLRVCPRQSIFVSYFCHRFPALSLSTPVSSGCPFFSVPVAYLAPIVSYFAASLPSMHELYLASLFGRGPFMLKRRRRLFPVHFSSFKKPGERCMDGVNYSPARWPPFVPLAFAPVRQMLALPPGLFRGCLALPVLWYSHLTQLIVKE